MLAPLLFLVFVNDIPQVVTSKIKLYADDILLYRTISSESDCSILQGDIDNLLNWTKDWQLYFNHEKCEVLRITNKRSPFTATYYMDNNIMHETSSVKYLGVVIDANLNWTEHIVSIVNKANLTLNFLKRNIRQCPNHIKINCVKSLIFPILEYACSVWCPFTQKDINTIEMIQRRAARFIFNDYIWDSSITNLLNKLKWQTLQRRRNNCKAIMLYKIIHKLVFISATEFLTPTVTHTRHNQHNYLIPSSRINVHLHSFFPSSIRIWNNLDDDIKQSPSLESFKLHILSIPNLHEYNQS